MNKHRGFTVIELLVLVALSLLAVMFFVHQKSQIDRVDRDRHRKIAINAFYYSLEEVYYKQKGSYPRTISATTLPTVEPDLFTDPYGKKIGDQSSSYFYEGTDCESESCKSYTLRAVLEAEDDFIKKSLH